MRPIFNVYEIGIWMVIHLNRANLLMDFPEVQVSVQTEDWAINGYISACNGLFYCEMSKTIA